LGWHGAVIHSRHDAMIHGWRARICSRSAASHGHAAV